MQSGFISTIEETIETHELISLFSSENLLIKTFLTSNMKLQKVFLGQLTNAATLHTRQPNRNLIKIYVVTLKLEP